MSVIGTAWLMWAASTALAADAVVVKDWPHSRGDPAMTGLSPVALRLPLATGWQFTMMEKPRGGEMLVASPVIRDGKVYAGCKQEKFFCIDLATGKKIWEVITPKGGYDGAAAFSDDLVIAGSQDGFIYAWNATTGKEAWKFETMAEIHAAANVWTDPVTKKDKIIIGSYDYSIYCLDAQTGKKEWSAETGNYVNGGAAISEGKAIVGGCDAVLHVHDIATGKEIKQIEVGAYIGNNVAIADDIVYVSHYGNRVGAYALGDGMRAWEYGERDFEFYAAPAILPKMIIVGGRDKRLHGIDRATGKGLWEFRARDRIDSSAVICDGKLAVFGCDDGYVYVVDVVTGKEAWHYEIGAPVRSSPAVTSEWVVIGADDGVMYAFKNGAHGG